jgi:hypothetical protein
MTRNDLMNAMLQGAAKARAKAAATGQDPDEMLFDLKSEDEPQSIADFNAAGKTLPFVCMRTDLPAPIPNCHRVACDGCGRECRMSPAAKETFDKIAKRLVVCVQCMGYLLSKKVEDPMDDLKSVETDLRQAASEIHCPNTEGGKYAAERKARLEAIADRIAALRQPASVPGRKAADDTPTVEFDGKGFHESPKTIYPIDDDGTARVRFVNKSNFKVITIVFDTSDASGNMEGTEWEFEKPGRYHYHLDGHEHLKGEIVVSHGE